ncbi:MAG: PLP-dependent aminotransferase family protein [Candidatus Obscuribacterales bacterium]|nr:PLP-dependent aminotransferase family protein [Candidatus Obscuribacterales bacterium]
MDLKPELDTNSDIPLFRQLAGHFKERIESLELPPGHLLPSTRELADDLNLSRSTIVRCYEELLAMGYLETIDGVGTFVNKAIPCLPQHWSTPTRTALTPSRYAQELFATTSRKLFAHDWKELNFGCAPVDQLPIKQWRQLLLQHSRSLTEKKLDYGQAPFGFEPLRKSVKEYLARARSVRCDTEQIIVFPTSLYALHLVSQLLVDIDDHVVMSDPGFPYARHTLKTRGANMTFLPVDQSGMLVENLLELTQKPKIVYVNPSHQEPHGTLLSIDRRKTLLNFAHANDTLIIEDDLDCQYRYTGVPAPSLQGLSESENVIYIGSFWKLLYPLVNVGYMVIPHSLIELFTHAWYLMYHTFHTQIPILDQLALSDLLQDGHLERHIRKTGQIYAKRFQFLVHNLTIQMKSSVRISPEGSGMHLTARFLTDKSDLEIQEYAQEANLPIVSTNVHYSGACVPGEFIIPFAHLSEKDIEQRVAKFAALALGPVS